MSISTRVCIQYQRFDHQSKEHTLLIRLTIAISLFILQTRTASMQVECGIAIFVGRVDNNSFKYISIIQAFASCSFRPGEACNDTTISSKKKSSCPQELNVDPIKILKRRHSIRVLLFDSLWGQLQIGMDAITSNTRIRT